MEVWVPVSIWSLQIAHACAFNKATNAYQIRKERVLFCRTFSTDLIWSFATERSLKYIHEGVLWGAIHVVFISPRGSQRPLDYVQQVGTFTKWLVLFWLFKVGLNFSPPNRTTLNQSIQIQTSSWIKQLGVSNWFITSLKTKIALFPLVIKVIIGKGRDGAVTAPNQNIAVSSLTVKYENSVYWRWL